jgi:hypothetical protein
MAREEKNTRRRQKERNVFPLALLLRKHKQANNEKT